MILNFLLLSTSLFSQSLSESDLNRISEQLLDSILNDGVTDDGMYVRQDDCIYGVKEDLTLSCFYVGGSVNRIADLNGDSISDLVLRVEDIGLGCGGNNYGYDYEVIILNAEKSIREKYSIFGGGKFSYAHLSIDSLANGRIFATYRQNPFAYYEIDDFEPDSLHFEFFIENGKLQEVHYAACPLSEMNKRVFRNDLDYQIERSLGLDDSFNEEQNEVLFLADGSHYNAWIRGCETIDLGFNHSFPHNPSLKTSKSLVKSTWIEHLDFLIATTRFSSMLSEVREELTKRKHQAFMPYKYGGFEEKFVLKNNWTCRLWLSGNEDQDSYVAVLFKKEVTEELEFWEELKRKFPERK